MRTGLKHRVGPRENHCPPFKTKFLGMGHISYEIIVPCWLCQRLLVCGFVFHQASWDDQSHPCTQQTLPIPRSALLKSSDLLPFKFTS